MKKLFKFLIALLFVYQGALSAQPHNAAYVKALYAKYPTLKTNFCPACKLWINPYYRSIADTQRHMPLVEYEFYTKANAELADRMNVPRTKPKKGATILPGQMPFESSFSSWHHVNGQPNEDKVYSIANKAAQAKDPDDEIAKGHVQAWILNSFAIDAVILSDTYTFNAALEDQKQNVGTEIATENYTRDLLTRTDVEVWGGTFGSQGTFTDGKITNTYPAYYWKIIKPHNGQPIQCYWMPNLITETQAMLPQRLKNLTEIAHLLGFDPLKIFPPRN